MNAGTVSLLVILGGNPVYSAPADLKFATAMQKVALRVHLGLYHDETAAQCHWHIPETHFLEMWSDVRGRRRNSLDRAAADRAAVRRPFRARVMSAFSEGGARSSYDVVRSFWMSNGSGDDDGARPARRCTATASFDQNWRKWLHDGIVPNTAFAPKTVTLQADLPAAHRGAQRLRRARGGVPSRSERVRRPLRQ